ncbi:metallophosphoesterase family protein [Paenibacillus radicis (ex Xue et al. 2023)]|uniref:Metallophosphoesterase family protein n=1 Tax=Paenibacillus radicis (ex Xue et al. 2023) TaxID=2972489 RepID=A0ABT1YIX0_9BACL|nr:metallophosphoesterase family protein [Paenibacillus radicis (ex Xue et al. 2023)]MCR8633122.1 metallophosphoesterase family protein [Paenibacillus radicis (ex Xue et al. 2023)]
MSFPLQFGDNGSFTIVQFTDLHWYNGDSKDLRTQQFMSYVIDTERPDLIIITGDIIHKKETPEPLSAFADAVSTVVESGIPWAFVYGNHEYEAGIDPDQLAELLTQLPNCFFEQGPETIQGISNYVLRIQSSRSSAVSAALYMMDSGAKTEHSFGGSTWFHHNQVDWYIRQSAAMTEECGGEPLPALAFFHIPLPEYREIWDYNICYGSNNKGISCPKINTGMFAAMVEMGDVMGTFVGHDHLNDYYGDLHGIRLCFSRLSGFNAKGPDDFLRGARMIRLVEGDRRFDTWQRLEDGSVISDPVEHIPQVVDPFGKR